MDLQRSKLEKKPEGVKREGGTGRTVPAHSSGSIVKREVLWEGKEDGTPNLGAHTTIR